MPQEAPADSLKEFEVIHTFKVATRYLAEDQEHAERIADGKGDELSNVLLGHESVVSAQLEETEVIELED